MGNTLTNNIENKKDRTLSRKTKRLIFYVLLFIYPVLQYAIMVIYVRFDSLIMAFEVYKPGTNGYEVSYVFLDNFKVAFNHIVSMPQLITNSLIMFACSSFLGICFGIIASYYIYKKLFMSKVFMFILFLPKVVAPIVFSIVFKYMATDVYMAFMSAIGSPVKSGLLSNMDTAFTTVIVYSLFMGMCSNILLYAGGMASINDSVVEYAQIDGVGFWQELFHVTIPGIYPTIVTFLTVSIAGIFTQQMHLFDFYGYGANESIQVLGYHFYVSIVTSDVLGTRLYLSFPQLTALGLIITFVMVPLTFTVKKLMYKFGPSND